MTAGRGHHLGRARRWLVDEAGSTVPEPRWIGARRRHRRACKDRGGNQNAGDSADEQRCGSRVQRTRALLVRWTMFQARHTSNVFFLLFWLKMGRGCCSRHAGIAYWAVPADCDSYKRASSSSNLVSRFRLPVCSQQVASIGHVRFWRRLGGTCVALRAPPSVFLPQSKCPQRLKTAFRSTFFDDDICGICVKPRRSRFSRMSFSSCV